MKTIFFHVQKYVLRIYICSLKLEIYLRRLLTYAMETAFRKLVPPSYGLPICDGLCRQTTEFI